MESFFTFLGENPYILLFFTVGMAVWVGKFSVKGYGLGMVAAAVVVGAALATWASTYGVKLQLDNFAKSLMVDVPDLPNFSRFHDAFRDDPKGKANEGHMRPAFFMAYDENNCEFIKLASPEIDKRMKDGPPLVSANFVIPYPPGFPIMVPGQVIEPETITYMRKLDVKEIHGYTAALGIKLIKPDALKKSKASSSH